jgi:hypothetical protein
LNLFDFAFQAPNVLAPPTHYFYIWRHDLSQVSLHEFFENKSRADHQDAVLPFSFSMSSSATLLLRTPGNRETVKKIHTPMGPATNFATALLHAALDQQERDVQTARIVGGQRFESAH